MGVHGLEVGLIVFIPGKHLEGIMMTESPVPSSAPDVVKRMTAAANDFLNSLDASQRSTASFGFEGDERYKWAYTPIDRNGLRVREMNDAQRDAAFKLMETGYSARGADTAHKIIELETILGEWEVIIDEVSQWERHTNRYWFSIFGTPGSVDEPWGFRWMEYMVAKVQSQMNRASR